MERLREDSSVPDMLEVKVPVANKDGTVIKFEIRTVVSPCLGVDRGRRLLIMLLFEPDHDGGLSFL